MYLICHLPFPKLNSTDFRGPTPMPRPVRSRQPSRDAGSLPADKLAGRYVMPESQPLVPEHGGYRKLKSFQMAHLVYDITARFCDRFIDRRSRTHDQMVQAARSGVQNIAEGSQASGTSKKMELKLTNVARASLEELRLDYEDFLRQRSLPQWPPNHPSLKRFKARRCATLEDVRRWVEEERVRGQKLGQGQGQEQGQELGDTDEHGRTRTGTDGTGINSSPCRPVLVRVSPCETHTPFSQTHNPPRHTPSSATLVANAALSLLNLCCYLLDRQVAAQAAAFEQEGGFTERLYRTRHRQRGDI